MSTDELPELSKSRGQGRSVLLGIGLVFLLHLLQIPLAWGLGSLVFQSSRNIGVMFYFSPLAIGVTQLVYLIPAILIARAKKKQGLAKGLAIGGALTFLLNGLCFLIFLKVGRIAG